MPIPLVMDEDGIGWSKWAAVVGYQVRVRCVSAGPARFAVSVPVVVPEGQVVLRGGQRGGRVRVRLVR